jgi:hypothetical protein
VIENNKTCWILRGTVELLKSLCILYIPQEIPLEELLTHEISLEDVDKAFELMKQLDCVKVLIKLWLILAMTKIYLIFATCNDIYI